MRHFDTIFIGSRHGEMAFAKKIIKTWMEDGEYRKKWAGYTFVNDGCTAHR